MPLWGNNDRANSEPLLPQNREVRDVAVLTTANATALGTNEIIFTTNPAAAGVANGMYVYATANNGLSRFFDTSIIDENDIAFKRSNNSVAIVRTGPFINSTSQSAVVKFANNTIAPIAAGQTIVFATAVNHGTNTAARFANDTILVTSTRLANSLIAGANNSVHQGWVRYTYKVNNDGTKRQLRETLVVLAAPTALNVSSGNTSTNSVFQGV
jgi:hypothetical protein